MCARESQERRGRAERDAEGPVLVAPREALDVGPHGGRVVRIDANRPARTPPKAANRTNWAAVDEERTAARKLWRALM